MNDREVRINLNEYVRFKLTDAGLAIYRHQFDDAISLYPQIKTKLLKPRLDSEGYASMQLHRFMSVFGPHLTLGEPAPIERLEIVYDVPQTAARLMTLEEVAGHVALGRETPIYMEFGPNSSHEGRVIGLIPKYMSFDDENGLSWDVCEGPDQGKRNGVNLYEYNDIWRCWTERPIDTQREAAQWN